MTGDYYIVLGGYKKGQDKDIDKIFKHFNNLPEDIPVMDDGENDGKEDED